RRTSRCESLMRASRRSHSARVWPFAFQVSFSKLPVFRAVAIAFRDKPLVECLITPPDPSARFALRDMIGYAVETSETSEVVNITIRPDREERNVRSPSTAVRTPTRMAHVLLVTRLS